MNTIIPIEIIGQKIYLIRGQKVMFDSDLAGLYQVPTYRLNEQVKRNLGRFPADFMFQLTQREKEEVIANCDNLAKLKFSPYLPHVFSEHGVAMLSSVLKSSRAVEINIYIIRAFIKLREILATNKELARKVDELDKDVGKIYSIISRLISEPIKPKGPIGFQT